MFYNELDILLIRLEEIYDLVDVIILVEATKTHNNTDKPLYYYENKHMFAKYHDKIRHLVTNFEEQYEFSQHIHAPNSNWFRENYQRECIQRVIQTLHLENNDIIITTDCDEIPKRQLLQHIRDGIISIENQVYSLEMLLYYYNIEWTTHRKWYHGKLLNYTMYQTFPLLTNIRFVQDTIVLLDAGYHLSYFGDSTSLKTKVESFAESIDYTKESKEIAYLHDCHQKGILHFNSEQLVFVSLEQNENVPVYFKNRTT